MDNGNYGGIKIKQSHQLVKIYAESTVLEHSRSLDVWSAAKFRHCELEKHPGTQYSQAKSRLYTRLWVISVPHATTLPHKTLTVILDPIVPLNPPPPTTQPHAQSCNLTLPYSTLCHVICIAISINRPLTGGLPAKTNQEDSIPENQFRCSINHQTMQNVHDIRHMRGGVWFYFTAELTKPNAKLEA